eukprot:TRINITY_DN6382_c1_g2_i1.p1 TRINITY_DN6382_c1_g2~~TRINITY_DN6382_c1_g2_i1.p1  ORF type:complete len:408 (+),score=104.00 TRINITY_DN6382_c1_g2_i1:93-1316(+)
MAHVARGQQQWPQQPRALQEMQQRPQQQQRQQQPPQLQPQPQQPQQPQQPPPQRPQGKQQRMPLNSKANVTLLGRARNSQAPSAAGRSAKLPFTPSSRTKRTGSPTSTSVGSEDDRSSSGDSLTMQKRPQAPPYPPGLVPEEWLMQARPSLLAPSQPPQPSFVKSGTVQQPLAPQSLETQVHEALALGTFSSLVKAYSHKSVATVEELMKLLDASGHPASIDDYNALLHAYSQEGDVVRSERCMQELERKGLTPNLISYNSVMNACAISGDVDVAVKWLARLQAAGLQPNDVTYGTVCKALSRRGDVAAIQAIIDALEGKGQPPNEYFYASLITACGNQTPPNHALAEEAFLKLVNKGLKVQSVKRVLLRVLGEQRARQLFALSAPPTSSSAPAAAGSASRPRRRRR